MSNKKPNLFQTVLKEDGWIIRENVEADTEEMQLSKNLPREVRLFK